MNYAIVAPFIQAVGIGSITDSLAAIHKCVFQDKTATLAELVRALDRDFEGDEPLRSRLVHRMPKYGNDDDAADQIMRRVFDAAFQRIDGRPSVKGGLYRLEMLPTTSHIYFGSMCIASADGRKAGAPLSEGISPVQGADTKGPTAVLRSASKMDHVKTGGTLLNMKLTPQLLAGDEGIARAAQLVRTYFKADGHHIQFNVVTADTLKAAQAHPDDYRGLIVRVAGYSDYFCDLSEALPGRDHRAHRARRTLEAG